MPEPELDRRIRIRAIEHVEALQRRYKTLTWDRIERGLNFAVETVRLPAQSKGIFKPRSGTARNSNTGWREEGRHRTERPAATRMGGGYPDPLLLPAGPGTLPGDRTDLRVRLGFGSGEVPRRSGRTQERRSQVDRPQIPLRGVGAAGEEPAGRGPFRRGRGRDTRPAGRAGRASAIEHHHAAYGNNLIGSDPDCRVHVSHRLLDLNGGLMFEALKGGDQARTLLPPRPDDHPEPKRLEQRFERFKALA